MPTAEALLRSRVFDGLTDAERERWLAPGTAASFPRGHTLARQGDPARAFYILESGFLKLFQLTAEGTELIVRFVVPGEPFGGVVALSDAPYPVTAVAVQPSVVRTWSREAVASCSAPRRRSASTHARDGHAHDRGADSCA